MTTIELPLPNEDGIFNVKLPVGEHILEVVAIDNLGRESDPVTVVILVEPDTGKEPHIEDFAPKWLYQSTQADPFVIKGSRLSRETKVEFRLNGVTDPTITSVTKPGSTTDTLQLVVTVPDNVEVGKRMLRLTNESGPHVTEVEFEVRKKQ